MSVATNPNQVVQTLRALLGDVSGWAATSSSALAGSVTLGFK